jgi:hypothetical protein
MGWLIASAWRAQAQIPVPQITYIFPSGGQRGQTVTVNVSGANLQGSTAVIVSGAGVTARVAPTADGKGLQNTNAGAMPMVVTIAPDAPLGVREVRVFGPRGVSNAGRLIVGAYAEMNETEPNNKLSQAQKINTPITINGQINGAEDEDLFSFEAKEGQEFAFEVDSFPLTFSLDSALILRDAQGRELATGRDPYRFDASLTYTFKKSGTYLIQIRDWTYSNGANFTYRLTVGTVPFITSVFPAGGQKGTQANVTLNGVNLPTKTQTVNVPADAAPSTLIPVSAGASNSVLFHVGATPEGIESEPNDKRENATRFAGVPLTINGRLDKPGDRDYFVFPGQSGQRFIFEVFSRRLNAPMDSIVYLYGPQGNEVSLNDDGVPGSKDSRIDFTFPATGDFTLMIRDAANRGGENFVYRIAIAPPPGQDFTLTATPDAPNVGLGGSAVITVNCQRLNGFNGEIALSIPNPPPGISVIPGVIRAGQNVALMSVTAAADAPVNFAPLEIVGTATINNQTVIKSAMPTETFTKRSDGQGQRAVSLNVMGIGEQPPYALKTSVTQLTLVQGQAAQVPVQVVRKMGFNGAINVTLGAQPQLNNINAPQVTIAGDKSEGVFTINAAANAGTINYGMFISGNANNVVQTTTLFALNVVAPPMALAINPNNPTVMMGAAVPVKVTLTRNNNFAGEVALSLAGLPNGVTGNMVTVPGDQKEATLMITASGAAAPGATQNITVKATTKVNGQDVTLSSPPLTLTVNAPFTLAVAPNNPSVQQGGTVQVKVTLTRNNFAGEVTLSLINLPKGVTAEEIKIAGDQKEATLTLTAADDAEVGNKSNVMVKATSTLNGQAVSINSPAVTLAVGKKG